MKIDIVVSSNTLETVMRLYASFSVLTKFDINFSVLLFGQKNNFNPPKRLPNNLRIFQSNACWLPIDESRNRCQKQLQHLMRTRNSIGMVLDDDKEWCYSQKSFIALMEQVHFNQIDMGFFCILKDAPIPEEYTRTSPMLDILLALYQHYPAQVSPELALYARGIRCTPPCSKTEHEAHHDFYSFNKSHFIPSSITKEALSENSLHWLKSIECGKASIRPLKKTESIKPATGRERGGATLILTPEILDYPNIAFTIPATTPHHENIVSRRSDMIMAMCCQRKGYQLAVLPSVFQHNRIAYPAKKEPNKLLGDMMGYALVNTLEHKAELTLDKNDFDYFYQTLQQRCHKTNNIICSAINISELLLENSHPLTPRQQPSIKKTLESIRAHSVQASMQLYLPSQTALKIEFNHVIERISETFNRVPPHPKPITKQCVGHA